MSYATDESGVSGNLEGIYFAPQDGMLEDFNMLIGTAMARRFGNLLIDRAKVAEATLPFEVLICLLLILIVLMQRPKSEGLGTAFGGN
jgi:hypothetical protein